MANQLRKLKKRQLLELLVAQGKELEAKQEALQSAQKQIAGLEGRLVKLGAGVRKVPRDGGAQAPGPERTSAAEEKLPEGDGGQKPPGRMDQ